MPQSPYTTYATRLTKADFPAANSEVLAMLVPGAPIVWRQHDCDAIPQSNVAATRYLHDGIARCKSRSVGSARTYGSGLSSWFSFCDESGVDPSYPVFNDLTSFKAWIQDHGDTDATSDNVIRDLPSAAGINGKLISVVAYYKWAYPIHLTEGDPMLLTDRTGQFVKTDEGRPVRIETKQILLTDADRLEPRNIPTDILHAILGQLRSPYRLCAILAVSCGLRASEGPNLSLAALKPSIDLSDGEFIPLPVRGKGGVTDDVYVPAEVYSSLLHYRDFTRHGVVSRMRRSNPSYKEPKTLFITERYGRPFSGRTLAKAFYQANDALNYTVTRYFFHGLRHTFAYTFCNELLLANEEKKRAGKSTFDVQGTVQDFMRHAHPETTDIYLRRAKRERALFSVRVNALYDKYLEAI